MADAVCSTSGMIQYAGTSSHTEFILGTEVGLLYPIARAHPDKKFYAASPRMLCPDMKKITLDDVRICLETGAGRVQVPEDIRIRALGAVHNMIQIK